MNLLRMSLAGAVMILVIAAIRALAINKLPKKAFLALWGVVAARLLIPYSFRSALSVYSLLGQFVPAEGAVKDTPAVPSTPMAPMDRMAPPPAASAGTMAAVSFDPWIAAWAVGALVCAAFFVMAYHKCQKEFQASLPVDNEYVKRWLSKHRICRTIEIRQSGRISAPLTYGVFRPVILMPKTADWDDLDTLKYVLTHEYVHIRRFDAVAKIVLTVPLCVHWFNPAVWLMYVLANRDIELSCDEAVIRQFGEGTKTAYAMALIRMEETRSGLRPLCNNFSKNAVEERIVAIMKMKRTSLAALIAAAVLVAGVTTAFATSAKADGNISHRDSGNVPDTVMEGADILSYVDSQDGKPYYSFDGGKTFQALTDEEYKARFPSSDVEWWTYDEYKAWLENEKVALQNMIGEWGWTGSRGEFVWTQEIVDETIAMYEGILENIKNGMLYAKTTDGEGDLFGMMPCDPENIVPAVQEDLAVAADFAPYEPYGLVWSEDEKALFWNGQRVRYFLDGADLDDLGAMAIRLEYADADFTGEIDVHTVRQRVQNADGSFDPMGPLTGLEKYSQADYDMNTLRVTAALEAEACTTQEIARELEKTRALLQAYLPFGLSYETDAATGEIRMTWQGKPVHSVFDAEKGVWVANSMRGLYLGPDAVDLTAVYERGELVGLQETQAQAATAASFVAEGNAAEPGTRFAERFAAYAPFGITYVEAEGASGAGNVYYNGQLVSRFADLTPNGGAFTFSSAEKGDFSVKTVYDNNGRLIGVQAVAG